MNDPFVDEQTKLIDLLANELIGTTPEHWSRATLEIESSRDADTLAYSIYSPDFRSETANPSDEMFALGRRLMQLFRIRGAPWLRLLLNIWIEGDDWKYRVEYTY